MTATSGAPWPRLKRAIVAILRGIAPHEAAPIVSALIEAGIEAIEIPLNSPDPFLSIAAVARIAPPGVLIGAGTVLDAVAVDRLNDAGGRLMVSPNIDPAVLRRANAHGMVTLPGVLTPTEALAAVSTGASGLKFFPASLLGPAHIQAIAVVLPPGTVIAAVGGVGEADFPAYAAAGIRTFGLGSSLYRPGSSVAEVRVKARAVLAAYDAAFCNDEEVLRAPR
jgi:2-dehydro-3-deoxyphosphogalactonate aldolase